MPPRTVSSNPNLAASRESVSPSVGDAANSSSESLPSATHTAVPVKMTSVLQRARALNQRAAAGQQAPQQQYQSRSPLTSPPLPSPYIQSNVRGGYAAAPFGGRRPSAAPSEGSTPGTPGSEGRKDSPVQISSPKPPDEQPANPETSTMTQNSEIVNGSSDLAGLPGSETDGGQTNNTNDDVYKESDQEEAKRKGEEVQGAGQAEDEEEQETPRQSTTLNIATTTTTTSAAPVARTVATATPPVLRRDSSKGTDPSPITREYFPSLTSPDRAGAATTAPKLPELYFMGSLVGDESTNTATEVEPPSSYLSPRNEPTNTGWAEEEESVNATSKVDTPISTQKDLRPSTPPRSKTEEEVDAGDRSFFWHSPQDSTDETDDEDDRIKTAATTAVSDASIKLQSTLTSATALGFGGPSDWEHFYGGDYEGAEMIDDTDLYLSKKEKDKQSQEEEAAQTRQGYDDRKTSDTQDSEYVDSSAGNAQRDVSALPTIDEHQEPEEQHIVPQFVEYETSLEDFARSPPPVTPAMPAASSGSTFTTIADQRTHGAVPTIQVDSASQRTSKETIIHTPADESEHEDAISQGTTHAQDPTPTASNRGQAAQDVRPVSKGANPPEITMPSEDRHSSIRTSSGPSSPQTDDPNASEITISMVLPPEFNPSNSPANSRTTDARFPPLKLADTRKSVFPQGEELPNPYSGLGPMSKSSLNRFVRMLREEEKADADHDKYLVFVNFVRHELKLRATLYDMDDESELSMPPSARQSVAATPVARKGRSPAPRPNTVHTAIEKSISASPTVSEPQRAPESDLKSPAGVEQASEGQRETIEEEPSPAKQVNGGDTKLGQSQASQETKSEKNALANGKERSAVTHQSSLETLGKNIDLIAPPLTKITIPASNLPTAGDQDGENDPQSSASPLPGAQILQRSLSVKSTSSRPYDGDKATNRQSIYRPFSGMLRSSSSQRRASMESIATVRSTERGLERKMTDLTSMAAMPTKATAHLPVNSRKSVSSGKRHTSLAGPLLSIIPHQDVLREEHKELTSLRIEMDKIADDFSFIHKTVLAWDSGAKVKRERHELERQQRISDNERRVDELFNDNEIGYGDISHLEDEFKRSESAKKAEEEREEVASFVSSVFDVVWARINYEMDQLTPLYQRATKLVAEASAGKQMFEDNGEQVAIAPIMEILLVLYQKLMIRYQKAFEAVLERDRRLKKTEVSPWFAIGEFEKVKRIEKRFEDAEKKAILEFCRQRDERANLLMDVLDTHTLRGVGSNQDYMESVMQAVRKIAMHIAVKGDSSERSGTKSLIDEVAKAKLVTFALARSSEQIVRTFHIADMLLNAADYEVSVANAKLSSADAAAFKRLRDAKANEDSKLAADLEHRLGLIRSDISRTHAEVAKLMLLLGVEDRDIKLDLTTERDKRMAAALETAAAKLEAMPPTPPKK